MILNEDLKTQRESLNFLLKNLMNFLKAIKRFLLNLLQKPVKWPVNERDFFVVKDDTNLGIKKMTSENSHVSSRIMQRAGSDYYEYRDTVLTT